jgi:hypothetical protein
MANRTWSDPAPYLRGMRKHTFVIEVPLQPRACVRARGGLVAEAHCEGTLRADFTVWLN